MNSTTIDRNLIKLDTYEKQAEFLNSMNVFGKPVMRVTPEGVNCCELDVINDDKTQNKTKHRNKYKTKTDEYGHKIIKE